MQDKYEPMYSSRLQRVDACYTVVSMVQIVCDACTQQQQQQRMDPPRMSFPCVAQGTRQGSRYGATSFRRTVGGETPGRSSMSPVWRSFLPSAARGRLVDLAVAIILFRFSCHYPTAPHHEDHQIRQWRMHVLTPATPSVGKQEMQST